MHDIADDAVVETLGKIRASDPRARLIRAYGVAPGNEELSRALAEQRGPTGTAR